MLRRYLPVIVIGFCITSLTILPGVVGSQPKTPDPGTDSVNQAVDMNDMKGGPLGFKTQKGLEGLQKLLEVSQPTQSPSIRRVLVPIPQASSGEMIRQEDLNYLPGVVATAEFHQIVEASTAPPSSPEELNFIANGQKGNLPGGGILHLRVNSNKSPVTATIGIAGVKIPGYEQVKQIEFVLPDTSAQ